MRTVAVTNKKGGVGKTSTACALAQGLAQLQRRVLCVDMDHQCSLTTLFPACPPARATLPEVIQGTADIRDAVQPVAERIDLVPGVPELEDVDALRGMAWAVRLRDSLSSLSAEYDYCIVDTPPAIRMLSTMSLTAAQFAVVTTNAQALSIRAVAAVLREIASVRDSLNPSLRLLGVLPTAIKTGTVLTREMLLLLSNMAEEQGFRLFAPIRLTSALGVAQALQADLFEYAPRSNAAVDYREFTNTVLNLIEGNDNG